MSKTNKQTYTLTDEVEMGHFPYIGGTTTISMEFSEIQSKEKQKEYLDIMDRLDHCLVTDNKDLVEFSARYFLLDNSVGLLQDVHTVLAECIGEDTASAASAASIVCTVKIAKESYRAPLKQYSKIIKCNYEG